MIEASVVVVVVLVVVVGTADGNYHHELEKIKFISYKAISY